MPVGIGTSTTDIDAGYVAGAAVNVSGFAWNDADSDGIRADDDTFVEDVVVELVTTDGTVVATGTTAADGSYAFRNVPPGNYTCLLYTSPSPRDKRQSRMPSSA